MRLGLFGGGFKPFTTGHHSKLLISLETCDVTCVFWGLGPRENITREVCQEMFSLYKTALLRTYGERLKVCVGVPSPITAVFATVGDVAFGTTKSFVNEQGVDISKVSTVSVFTSTKDLPTFTKCLGTPNESKYYGTLRKDGKLRFITEEDEDYSSLTKICVTRIYGSSDIDRTINVRATAVRKAIQSGENIEQFIPKFLTDEEKCQVISLIRGKV
jgi:hypothetical protein